MHHMCMVGSCDSTFSGTKTLSGKTRNPYSVKAVEADGQDVSNARMQYVADPLAEDAGICTASTPPPVSPPPSKGKKQQAKVADGGDGAEEQGGRQSIIKTFRESISKKSKVAGGGKGSGDAGKVDVAVWKGIGGDDHVPGECLRAWFEYYYCGRLFTTYPGVYCIR